VQAIRVAAPALQPLVPRAPREAQEAEERAWPVPLASVEVARAARAARPREAPVAIQRSEALDKAGREGRADKVVARAPLRFAIFRTRAA